LKLPPNHDATQPEKRHDPSLKMIMCRYINGVLRKDEVVLAGAEYIAISHTWGYAPKQKIDIDRLEAEIIREKV
jgi:hypothetical protein